MVLTLLIFKCEHLEANQRQCHYSPCVSPEPFSTLQGPGGWLLRITPSGIPSSLSAPTNGDTGKWSKYIRRRRLVTYSHLLSAQSLFFHCLCSFITGFPNLDTVDIWDQIVLCFGVCPVHHRIFGGIPDLYLLDTGSNPSPAMS